MNFPAHILRQIEFSKKAFGPPRDNNTAGIIDHLWKELAEVEEKPDDLLEWIDLIILAIEGAWRNGFTAYEIAAALAEKQEINEKRKWPDWRTVVPGKAIEHIRKEETDAAA